MTAARSRLDRWWPIAGAALVVALVTLAAWPLTGAFLHEDDFALLALARMLADPLPAFVEAHMLTMPYYRPLGVVVWWLSARAFDTALAPQYLLAIGLHVGVALALAGLLGAFRVRRTVAWTLALAFASAPATLATVGWLADRYDLLATLFGLLALTAMRRHARAPSWRRLALAMLALAAALASKETGVVIAFVAALIGWCELAPGPARRRALVAIAGLLAVYFLARSNALGFVGGGQFTAGAAARNVVVGFGNWWAELPAHFGYLRWLPRGGWIALTLAALGALALHVGALRGGWTSERRTLALAGLALVVLTALVQSPFIGIQPIQPLAGTDITAAVTQSRYYYLAFAGIVLLLAALAGTEVPPRSRVRGVVSIALAVAWLAPSLLAAHALAREWRDNTRAFAPLVTAATEAIDRLQLPARGCEVFLLASASPMLEANTDVVVKAVAPRLSRVAACVIASDRAPWFQLLPAGSFDAASAGPLLPLVADGRRVPWPRVGNLRVVYLAARTGAVATPPPGARFLAREGDRFVDFTATVRTGKRQVTLRCARQSGQCP